MLDWIQDAWLSRLVSESTWGYPLVGAVHVLAIALFGGTVLVTQLRVLGFAPELEVRFVKAIGLILVLITGLLLFASGASHYYDSTAFRIKMGLLVLLALNAWVAGRKPRRVNAIVSLILWSTVIFASRAIAYF